MTGNASDYGPSRQDLLTLLSCALKESDLWRDVQAICISEYVVAGRSVLPDHIAKYKSATEQSSRLSACLESLLSVRA